MSLFYRGAPYAPENHAVSGVETGLSARFLGRFYPFMEITYTQIFQQEGKDEKKGRETYRQQEQWKQFLLTPEG